jgi:hypothetical protein
MSIIDLEITTQKTTDWATQTPQKPGMNSGASSSVITMESTYNLEKKAKYYIHWERKETEKITNMKQVPISQNYIFSLSKPVYSWS